MTFTIDTFTENYAKYIKRPDQISFLEIGKNARENILCFDTIVCQPRIYTPETPSPEHLDEYYTMEEADEKFATISGFNELSGIVSGDIQNLANNYWTKQEVAEQIANIERLTILVVQELPPAEEGQDFTIYLVPDSEGSIDNNYLEYLRINGEWELIGSTAIDLSQYYTKGEVNSNFLALSGGIVSGDVTCNALNVSGLLIRGNASGEPKIPYLVVGNNNPIVGGGGNNVIIGEQVNQWKENGNGWSYSNATNTLLIGERLTSVTSNSLLVGEYGPLNKDMTSGYIDLKFGVAGGTSLSDRRMAMWVKKNGDTTISGNLTLAGGLSASGITVNGAIFTGPVSLNGHQVNTPGGFVVQDLSGKITADYLEATSGLTIQDGQVSVLNGDVIMKKALIRQRGVIDLTKNPSAAEVENIVALRDKNGTSYFRIIVYHLTGGAVRVAFETYAGKGITVVTDAQGNTHIEAPTPDVSSNTNTVATTKFVKDAIAAALAARGL